MRAAGSSGAFQRRMVKVSVGCVFSMLAVNLGGLGLFEIVTLRCDRLGLSMWPLWLLLLLLPLLVLGDVSDG